MTDPATNDMSDLQSRAAGAFLAAAVGDALGWPQETRAHRVGGQRGIEPRFEFVGWVRREGGRYQAHEEPVEPGEYSDDVQLMLAISRSVQRGERWWQHWTERELPFWTLYERGGGGATKRAATLWGRGHAPWKVVKEDDRGRYFDAGGNGVVMRILPHCIAGARQESFTPVATAIMADGITTHGHPRALVGSLAYGFAVWRMLRRDAPLGYGALIEETVTASKEWSRLPDVADIAPDWEQHGASMNGYKEAWQTTVEEMIDLLGVAKTGIDQGSLAVDRGTLEDIGCFDKAVGGAGTVTAAGALFLASRYASQPRQGMLAGAFAMRADTDTLASTTGGLLGAVNGGDWLGDLARQVQDAPCLRRVATELWEGRMRLHSDGRGRWSESASRKLLASLPNARLGDQLDLPIGVSAEIAESRGLPARSESISVHRWVLRTAQGQTLRIKKVERVTSARRREPQPTDDGARQRPRVGLVLMVRDLARATDFYRDILGLEVTKRTPQSISFVGTLVLQPHVETTTRQVESPSVERGQLPLPDHDGSSLHASHTIMVVLDSEELIEARRRMEKAGVPVSEETHAQGARRLRCADPDGNVIELRERTRDRGEPLK